MPTTLKWHSIHQCISVYSFKSTKLKQKTLTTTAVKQKLNVVIEWSVITQDVAAQNNQSQTIFHLKMPDGMMG